MQTLQTITTVQQLADYLDVPEKKLRRWLREDFPQRAPGQGSAWTLTPEMNSRMAGRSVSMASHGHTRCIPDF